MPTINQQVGAELVAVSKVWDKVLRLQGLGVAKNWEIAEACAAAYISGARAWAEAGAKIAEILAQVQALVEIAEAEAKSCAEIVEARARKEIAEARTGALLSPLRCLRRVRYTSIIY